MTLLDDVTSGAAGETPVTALLRNVKILSSRTQTTVLADWVDHELNGYPDGTDIPVYRGPFKMNPLGHFVGPYQSEMRNVQIPPSTFPIEHRRKLFEMSFEQPIAELEAFAKDEKGVRFSWPADAVQLYKYLLQTEKARPVASPMMVIADVHVYMPSSTFVRIIDGVRTKILDLALELERVAPLAGQAGAPAETATAAATVINNYFQAPSNVSMGSGDVTQIVVNLPEEGDKEGLIRYLSGLGVPISKVAELEAALEADAAAADEPDATQPDERWPRTRQWLRRVVTDTMTGTVAGVSSSTIIAAGSSFLGFPLIG